MLADLLRFDTQSHGHYHFVYREPEANHRNLERAHQRCVERGIPCTEPALTPWGDAGIRFFFAEVGGIVFEVMRAEAAGP